LKTHKLKEGESVVVVKEYGSEKKAEAWFKKNLSSPIEVDRAILELEIGKCTPTQQKFIRMYMEQMKADGDEESWMLSVASDMAKLYQGGIESVLKPGGERIKVENDTVEGEY
jgi:hypothetical protein